MQSSKRKNYGFTLIEIQIALLLLVMIMGLLFGALHMASRSWKTGQALNEKIEEKRLVAEFLRKQINQIIPILWVDGNGSDLIFRGEPGAMLFVGKLPANRLSGLPSLLQLNTTDEETIEFGYAPLTPDKTPFDTRNDRMLSTVLANNIKSIKFQYFGRLNKGSKPSEWYESWASRKLLPRLIKCQITSTDDDVWPEMTFPIHIDNTSGFRQFFLQESVSYQYNSDGDVDPRQRTGPTVPIEDVDPETLNELF